LIIKAGAWRHRLPWGREAGLQKYDLINALAKKNGYQDYGKVGENHEDEATERMNTGSADPVWRECIAKSEACRAMLLKCIHVANPFTHPGLPKLTPNYRNIWNWLKGDDD